LGPRTSLNDVEKRNSVTVLGLELTSAASVDQPVASHYLGYFVSLIVNLKYQDVVDFPQVISVNSLITAFKSLQNILRRQTLSHT
jgi:hypothetical protein